MKKLIAITVVCFIVVSCLFVVGKGLFFYQGRYQPPPTTLPNLADINAPALAAEAFSETPEKRAGTVLIDFAHDNNFSPWELNILLSRVVSRGFAVEFWRAKPEDKAGGETRARDLEGKLRFVDTLIVISPQIAFAVKEIDLIKEFVKKGGKLLLIEDPTRRPAGYAYQRTESVPINDIATEFDFLFESDYLYNLKENNGNYRYVFFKEFTQHELTRGLGQILLYSAGSFSGSAMGVVFTDENTYSSKTEARGRLSPLVLATDSKVLGVYDLTFLIEPYNASFDNNQLISNISDWLTVSGRTFSLADFPYFLEDAPVAAYSDVSLLRQGLEFKNFLTDMGKNPSVAKYEETASLAKDTVYISLFKESAKIKKFLDSANIIFTETNVEIKGMGTIPQKGLAIIYLHREGEKEMLAVLAETDEKLKETLDLLKSGGFRQWLVSDTLAIYPPAKEKEEKKPEEKKEPEKPPEPPKPK